MIQLTIRCISSIIIRVINYDLLSDKVKFIIDSKADRLNAEPCMTNCYKFESYQEALTYIKELSDIYDIAL